MSRSPRETSLRDKERSMLSQLNVGQAFTAGTLVMVFSITFFTARSDEPMHTFLASTAVSSVVLLASTAVLSLLTRSK